jgi:hypothetical protein
VVLLPDHGAELGGLFGILALDLQEEDVVLVLVLADLLAIDLANHSFGADEVPVFGLELAHDLDFRTHVVMLVGGFLPHTDVNCGDGGGRAGSGGRGSGGGGGGGVGSRGRFLDPLKRSTAGYVIPDKRDTAGYVIPDKRDRDGASETRVIPEKLRHRGGKYVLPIHRLPLRVTQSSEYSSLDDEAIALKRNEDRPWNELLAELQTRQEHGRQRVMRQQQEYKTARLPPPYSKPEKKNAETI